MDKKITIGIFLLMILIFGFLVIGKKPEKNPQVDKIEDVQQTVNNEPTKKETIMPELIIDQEKTYTALLKTDLGVVKISLFADKTPITVNNFVSLSKKGFYDGTVFHRIIKGFMIQGGDPEGNGTGGPGYKFDDEPFEGEYERGTIAMANAGPNTNGSQFFIMHQNYGLPKNYVIFGKVIEGIEVVDKIANSPVKAGLSAENSTPTEPTVIESIQIIEE